MEELTFYDLKGKRKFETTNYDIKTRNVRGHNRRFAVAVAPSGVKAWRILKG